MNQNELIDFLNYVDYDVYGVNEYETLIENPSGLIGFRDYIL